MRSGITRVTLPATLRTLGCFTFSRCERLKRVVFREGSVLERIGHFCFCGTRSTEVTFPRTLRKLAQDVFGEDSDGTVYVEDGFEIFIP